MFQGGATAGAGTGGRKSERKACFVKPVKLKVEIFFYQKKTYFLLEVDHQYSIWKWPLKGPFECIKLNITMARSSEAHIYNNDLRRFNSDGFLSPITNQ